MDHVNILLLVACFMLLNLAQMEDKTLLMMCLFSRHKCFQNQATVLLVGHCRRQTPDARHFDATSTFGISHDLTAARLADLGERRSAEREGLS